LPIVELRPRGKAVYLVAGFFNIIGCLLKVGGAVSDEATMLPGSAGRCLRFASQNIVLIEQTIASISFLINYGGRAAGSGRGRAAPTRSSARGSGAMAGDQAGEQFAGQRRPDDAARAKAVDHVEAGVRGISASGRRGGWS
jgi:hypothetical protein